jgi:hypothetical protein
MRNVIVICFVVSLLNVGWSYGNDSAVETSAGGLQLRQESSVSMQRERLFISPKLVAVEYEFLNTSKVPVVTEVAFPIPPYSYVFDDLAGDRDFSDFKAWIDGKPIKVSKEVRAFVNGREVTKDLLQAGITIEKFGKFDPSEDNHEIFELGRESKRRLVKVGALKAPNKKESSLDYWPKWDVHIKYHWKQEFAPGSIVKIKHTYSPVVGFTRVYLGEFKSKYGDACITTEGFESLAQKVSGQMKVYPEEGGGILRLMG